MERSTVMRLGGVVSLLLGTLVTLYLYSRSAQSTQRTMAVPDSVQQELRANGVAPMGPLPNDPNAAAAAIQQQMCSQNCTTESSTCMQMAEEPRQRQQCEAQVSECQRRCAGEMQQNLHRPRTNHRGM